MDCDSGQEWKAPDHGVIFPAASSAGPEDGKRVPYRAPLTLNACVRASCVAGGLAYAAADGAGGRLDGHDAVHHHGPGQPAGRDVRVAGADGGAAVGADMTAPLSSSPERRCAGPCGCCTAASAWVARLPGLSVVLGDHPALRSHAGAFHWLLAGEGIALMAARGCPLGFFQRRAGDDVPMFELWLGPGSLPSPSPRSRRSRWSAWSPWPSGRGAEMKPPACRPEAGPPRLSG